MDSQGDEEALLRTMGLPTSFAATQRGRRPHARRREDAVNDDGSGGRKKRRHADVDDAAGVREGDGGALLIACGHRHSLQPSADHEEGAVFVTSPPCQYEGAPWLWYSAVDHALDLNAVRAIPCLTESVEAVLRVPLCDPDLLARVAAAKEEFHAAAERHSTRVFYRARDEANPFESLGSGPFCNRAALKLAVIDHVAALGDRAAVETREASACGGRPLPPSSHLVTKSQAEDAPSLPAQRGEGGNTDETYPAVGTPNGTFTFVDLCGGPGGFTEYLLWRHGRANGPDAGAKHPTASQKVRGWCMSLRCEGCDWDVAAMKAARELLSSVHITYGADGTGNVYSRTNVDELARLVTEGTAGKGVHVVVADGGFEGARDRHDQEAATFRILVSQIAAALRCLGRRGDFVCKAFDLVTQRSASVLWILSRLFETVSIAKPVTSRPANSERYLVCKGLVADSDTCRGCAERLFAIGEACGAGCDALADGAAEAERIAAVVDPIVLANDTPFLEFVVGANARLCQQQLEASHELVSKLAQITAAEAI